MTAVTVVMPAHNEEDYLSASVATVVEGMRRRCSSFEVLVVENGSGDRTAEVARALEAAFPEVRALSQPEADYGRALQAGLLEARGELVVNFDVDFVDLGFFDQATAGAAAGRAAIVVGTKRGPGASDDRNLARRLVTAVFSVVMRRGFGLQVSDTHGLKLLRRDAVLSLAGECRFGGDIFDTELVLRAERAGLLVTEIPVVVAEQRPPRTSILRRIPRSLLGLARLRLALARERLPER